MGAFATALAIFVVVGGAALAGLLLGRRLPRHHMDEQSRDVVRTVAGFLSTLSALVLGLLLASAKANFDEHSAELHRIAGDVLALDRALAHYGPDAAPTRTVLRDAMTAEVGRLAHDARGAAGLNQPVQAPGLRTFYYLIEALPGRTEEERAARDHAAQLADGIVATRTLMVQDTTGSIPAPFLLILVFWLAALFASFGLFARANATVATTLLVGAASVTAAMFLILQLDHPLAGLMRLSIEPLRQAAMQVGR